MKKYPITYKNFGQSAILVEWPNEVSEEILEDIIQYKTTLEAELSENFEFVIAYNSLTIIDNEKKLDLKVLETQLVNLYQKKTDLKKSERILWEIPVCYDAEFGIDLEEVASNLKITVSELIEKHTSYTYTVYGIGFLPGFLYLGGLPNTMETKRRASPRLKVAKGAVGLAGKQTGIYPQESPGGWNIIGNCPIPIFNVKSETPCFVKVGDKIQFKAITRGIYKLQKIEAEIGIYKLNKTLIDA